jgi:PA domain/RING-like zinc finger
LDAIPIAPLTAEELKIKSRTALLRSKVVMRTPRIIILGAFIFTTITLTYLSSRSSGAHTNVGGVTAESQGGIHALFSFTTPITLFPPNAIISLTDDNTTSFLARPAAFGPLLPSKGLSGELWIGSGFGDDSFRQGAIVASVEGELGCSDVPGWVDGNKRTAPPASDSKVMENAKDSTSKSNNRRRGSNNAMSPNDRAAVPGQLQAERVDQSSPSADDGTDDYLHHPLPGSTVTKPSRPGHEMHEISSGSQMDHADIQSIQEAAEIAGKIVLLSRGGCGFLEKVKWAQRRGGIALIVGDDTRGGPLIQMYARGDTSNVTIPSVFTSRTTAHLLSSLIPPGTYIEESIDANGKISTKVQQSKKPKKSGKKISKHNSPATESINRSAPKNKVASINERTASTKNEGRGWLSALFSKSKSPSDNDPSGNSDWVLVDEYDEKDDNTKGASKPATKFNGSKAPLKDTSGSQVESEDDFVIGVQDWRDPDLVDGSAGSKIPQGSTGKQVPDASQNTAKLDSKLKGGSITPGSGEYDETTSGASTNIKDGQMDRSPDSEKSGLLAKLFGDDEDESNVSIDSNNYDEQDPEDDEDIGDQNVHNGLWVTLTPTTGASPFFDTLLVLVVSPLVTLTVVYALLLLRSRIRRRRWRAPKSVVERLPVRTYQTIASTNHSRLPSPTSSSPATPLLQQPVSRPRPRSRTTSGIPEPGNPLRAIPESSPIPRAPSRGPEHEKGSVTSEWKKYMGKQVECVVCLEEYVDGVSQVMSLPCGHEFHVECM